MPTDVLLVSESGDRKLVEKGSWQVSVQGQDVVYSVIVDLEQRTECAFVKTLT